MPLSIDFLPRFWLDRASLLTLATVPIPPGSQPLIARTRSDPFCGTSISTLTIISSRPWNEILDFYSTYRQQFLWKNEDNQLQYGAGISWNSLPSVQPRERSSVLIAPPTPWEFSQEPPERQVRMKQAVSVYRISAAYTRDVVRAEDLCLETIFDGGLMRARVYWLSCSRNWSTFGACFGIPSAYQRKPWRFIPQRTP